MPELVRTWPAGSAYLIDQLKRALSSVILNIAEGNGRRSFKDRRRFFDISIGSAQEVSSIFDVAFAYGYIGKTEYDEQQDKIIQIVKMLYKLK
jgi:four helix bundle protein